MTKWIETDHTDGWWFLKEGNKELAQVVRVQPRRTKSGGWRYKYQAVTRWGLRGGLPGSFGAIFTTLKAAKEHAERMARA